MAIFKSLAQRKKEAVAAARKVKLTETLQHVGGLTPKIGDKFHSLVDIDYVGRKLDRAAQRRAKARQEQQAEQNATA